MVEVLLYVLGERKMSEDANQYNGGVQPRAREESAEPSAFHSNCIDSTVTISPLLHLTNTLS